MDEIGGGLDEAGGVVGFEFLEGGRGRGTPEWGSDPFLLLRSLERKKV